MEVLGTLVVGFLIRYIQHSYLRSRYIFYIVVHKVDIQQFQPQEHRKYLQDTHKLEVQLFRLNIWYSYQQNRHILSIYKNMARIGFHYSQRILMGKDTLVVIELFLLYSRYIYRKLYNLHILDDMEHIQPILQPRRNLLHKYSKVG